MKKNILTLIIIIGIMISMVACGNSDDKDFLLGTVNGNVYENSFIGIGCELDKNWNFYNEEQILEVNDMTKDMVGEDYKKYFTEKSYYIDMMAVHSNGMDTVNINVQKLELAQSMFSEDDYIDSAANDDLKASLESMGITVTDMSVIEENFMGKKRKAISISGDFSGHKVYERVYAIKKGTRIAAITFAQWDNSDFSNLKDSFYAVSK